MPVSNVYIGILGRSDDMLALETFAWKGNQDTPRYPDALGRRHRLTSGVQRGGIGETSVPPICDPSRV